MNAMQFQKWLSMVEFQERYGHEGQYEQAVIESRWPEGFEATKLELPRWLLATHLLTQAKNGDQVAG